MDTFALKHCPQQNRQPLVVMNSPRCCSQAQVRPLQPPFSQILPGGCLRAGKIQGQSLKSCTGKASVLGTASDHVLLQEVPAGRTGAYFYQTAPTLPIFDGGGNSCSHYKFGQQPGLFRTNFNALPQCNWCRPSK